MPVAPTLSDQTGGVSTPLNILLPVGTGGDSPLSYTATNLPSGLSFNTSTRRITGTPTTLEVKTVTYTVTDADGDANSSTFTFTITDAFRISSWNGTNYLNPIVLARLSATVSGADITVDPVTPLEGELVVASDLTIDGVERYANGTQIRLRKNGDANFNKYFNNSGSPKYPAAKLFIVLNDVGKTHIPFTRANSGGGFSNWNIDDGGQNSLINAIATGDQFLLAIAEPDLTPALPTVSDQTGIQNTAYTPLLLPVGTSGNGTLVYTIANLPAGLSFDASTRGVTGTPTTPQVKIVTYTVTDEDGSADSREFTFTIAADLVPSAPTVADQTGVVSTALTITLAVGTGGDGALAYTISGLPSGLSFDSSTRVITGTPTTAERKTVTYTVTDADGDANSSTFTFTISPEDLTPSAPTVQNQTGVENTALTITLPVGTGGDGDLVYTIANLPSGLSFNASTREITGTPSTPETKTVTYTVTDADGDADSSTFTFTIAADLVPSAPALSDQTGVVRTAVDLTLAVGTGGDGALVYTIANLPGGLSFNADTRKITGTPTTEETKTVTYTVTDADGDANSSTFTFTISPEDLTPSTPSLFDWTGVVNTAVDITLPVGTGGNSPLTYSIANLPAGLSFNANTRKITGTPTTAERKTVTYTVTDADGDADSDTFTFTIGPEDLTPSAPVIPDKTGIAQFRVSVTLPVGTGGNSPLTYTVSNLPAGLSFNPSTREITGIATTAQIKIVTYTVTDVDNDADSSTFTFTIAADRVPSEPAVQNQIGDVGTALTITLPVGTGGNSPLTYSISNLPSGLSFNANTRTITGTPTTPQRKTVTYMIMDADGDGASSRFTFTITAGLTPTAPFISSKLGKVNSSVDLFLAVGTGGDGRLTHSIANLPAGLSFDANTRRITGTPTTPETKTVTYTVTDANGDSDSSTFTFQIVPDLVPSAPTVSTQTGVVRTAVDITLPVGTGGDSPLTYAISNLPSGLSFNARTRKITGTPTTAQTKTVTYTVTDDDGDSNRSTFTFTIGPEDLTPSAPTLSDQTGIQNTAVDLTLAVGTGGNSPLTYAISNLPSGLSFNTGTRKITGTPTTAQVKTVTYTVTDADNDVDSSTFTFTIVADLAPSAPTVPPQTRGLNNPLDITLPVGTGGNSPLTYSIANLPAGLAFNTNTRKVTGTPTTEETKTVTYTVTDADGDSNSSTFVFTITTGFRISNWNGAGYFSPIVLARLSATISGSDITVDPVTPLEGGLVVASDLTIDGVERHVGGAQIRLRKNGDADFSTYFDDEASPQYPAAKLFIVLNDQNFTHIPCTIANTGGGFNNWSVDTADHVSLINAIVTGNQFLLAIAEPDLTPVLPSLTDQTGVQNTAITPLILPVASSGDGTLVYTIANLPSGLAFDASTRTITGTPTADQVKTVTYTVTDEDGSADSETFTFTIGADLAPVAPSISDKTGVTGTAVSITLPIGTGGDGTLVYTIANLPTGLSFNASTREITGTPSAAEVKTVTYTVTDADGDTDSSEFTFTIVANLVPSAPALSDQTGDVNTAVSLILPVGTGGNSPLTYAATNLPTGLAFNTSTRRIGGTPSVPETRVVTYTVTDADGDTDSSTFTFTILPNLIPVAPTLSDQTGRKNIALTITLDVGTGGDGDLVYTIANLPAGLSFNVNTREITGTPTTEETKTVTYTVTDADADADSSEFTFTILPSLIPVAPTVPTQRGVGNVAVSITLPVGTGGDGILTYAISNLPTGLSFNADTREITGTSTTGQTKTVTYTVTDADGDSDSSEFTFIISADVVPVAPALSDQTGVVNTAVSLILAEGTSGNLPLSYSIANLPAGLSFNADTREITGTPTTAQTKTVTYTVTDADNDADSETFTFTIAANKGPIARAGDDQTVAAGATVTLDGSASTDPDGHALTYTWTEVTNSRRPIMNADASIATFAATSRTTQTILNFRLTVDDGVLSSTDEIQVTVSANLPPYVVITAPSTASHKDVVTLDASGSTDPEGQALTYIWTQIKGFEITLENADTSIASFTVPLITGISQTLTFQVAVSDGTSSTTNNASVVINAGLSVPISQGQVALIIEWYDKDLTLISEEESSATRLGDVGLAWLRFDALFNAPINATGAKFKFIGEKPLQSTGNSVYMTAPYIRHVVEGDLLAPNSVTTDKIVDDAITNAKLGANVVDTANIIDSAITNAKLGDDSVDTANIVALAITNSEIAVDAVHANNILANTIKAAQIAAGTITANEIASQTIRASEIAAGTITANEIASQTIVASKIQAGTISGDKIATNTITALNIAASAITASELATNSITSNKIRANAITSNKITAGAVGVDKLAANSVNADKIVARSITAGQIAVGAISSTEIVVGGIKGTRIAQGTIQTSHLAAKIVTASKILLGSGFIIGTGGKISVNTDGFTVQLADASLVLTNTGLKINIGASSPLSLTATGLDITGTISADHISADVQNVAVLYSKWTTVLK